MCVGEVGLEASGASAGRLDLPGQRARAGFRLVLVQRDGHPPVGQCLRHGATQPTAGAGYQCHLAP
jgi:hypothetical protein